MLNIVYRLAPFYTAVIAYLSLADNAAPAIAITNIDKVYHATAYFLMAVLWYLFFYARFLKSHAGFSFELSTILGNWEKTIAIGAGVVSLIAGAFLELGQGFISANRSMDILDMIANSCGIILALVGLWFLSKKIR